MVSVSERALDGSTGAPDEALEDTLADQTKIASMIRLAKKSESLARNRHQPG